MSNIYVRAEAAQKSELILQGQNVSQTIKLNQVAEDQCDVEDELESDLRLVRLRPASEPFLENAMNDVESIPERAINDEGSQLQIIEDYRS